MAKHVYIHIPFCNYICTFCDFKRDIITKHNVKEYIEKVIAELNGKYETIYIGGGTPNCIDDVLLFELLSNCKKHLDINYEFTIECNPDSITQKQSEIFKECGVNRVSMGVQTTNDKILRLVNRKHSKKDVENAIDILYKNGITNVSLDFIYNLPFLSIKDIDDSINLIKKYDIKHTSFYSLELKEGSVMTKKGQVKIDSDIEEEQMLYIIDKLKLSGYKRYEVGSWAISDDYQSIHNKAYWQTKDWQGIGFGAHGFENMVQYSIDGSIDKWIRNDYKMNKEEYYQQILMMGLRLVDGIDLKIEKNLRAFEYFKDKLKLIKLNENKLICDDVSLLFSSIEGIF